MGAFLLALSSLMIGLGIVKIVIALIIRLTRRKEEK